MKLSIRPLLACAFALALGTAASAQSPFEGGNPLDVSKLDNAEEVPPIESRELDFEDDVAELTFTLEDSTLFEFEVEDPRTLYRISAEPAEAESIVLEVSRIALNEKGQATDYDIMLSDTTQGYVDPVALIPPTTFETGTVYLGLAPLNAVETTLRVERVPAAESAEDLPPKRRQAVDASNDLAGYADGKDHCVKPALLRAGELVDVELISAPDAGTALRVFDREADARERRSERQSTRVSGIRVPGGTVCLEVKGKDRPAGWRLLVTPSVTSDASPEPNPRDSKLPLKTLPVDGEISGVLDQSDEDTYELPQLGEGQGLELSYEGRSWTRLCVSIAAGKDECHDGRKMTYGPVVPQEGATLRLVHRGGPGAAYELSTRVVEARAGEVVLEPNAEAQDQPLLEGAFRIEGELGPKGDRDVIGFDTGLEPQMWRFVILGEAVDKVIVSDMRQNLADLRRHGRNGRRLTVPDIYLQPGPAYLSLTGSEGDYKVIAKPLGPPRPDAEREPNAELPRRVNFDERVTGVLDRDDADRFSFFLSRQSPVTVSVKVPAGAEYRAEIDTGEHQSSPEFDRESMSGDWSKTVELPAGENVLTLRPHRASPAEYRLTLDYASPFQTGPDAPVQLSLSALPEVRAYSLFRQSLTAEVTLENTSDRPVSGQLETWFARPRIESAAPDVTLDPGQKTSVPLTITLPRDLYDGELAWFASLEAKDGQSLGEVRGAIVATPDADPLNRAPHRPAPASLIGGINLALAPLGAEWVAVDDYEIDEEGDYARGNPAGADNLHKIIDGYIVQGVRPVSHRGYLTRGKKAILSPVLDLAGEAPVQVAGIGINTRMVASSTAIHRFAVDLSEDGESWETVLEATHDTWGDTAYYPLDTGPRAAKFARLRSLDRRGGEESAVSLTEFQVIGVPGYSGLGEINIADHALGALVSGFRNMRPRRLQQIEASDDRLADLAGRRAPNPTEYNMAITFRNQRAADIEALEFIYPEETAEDDILATEAIIFASPAGPAGPWREIGRTPLPAAPEPEEVVRYTLPEWETARAVKVEYDYPEDAYSFHIPARIRVIERPESGDYRSVIGVWGERSTLKIDLEGTLASASPEAMLEAFSSFASTFWQTLTSGSRTAEAEGAEAAEDLLVPGGDFEDGLVEFQARTESWRVEAGDANTVRLVTRGSPGFDPSLEVTDADGTSLEPLDVIRSNFSDETVHVYPVEPGSHLDVEVSEVQRSTVFLFDQSASVSSKIPAIRRAIIDYAGDMVPGRDAIHFKAFGGKWPREDWYTDPNVLRRDLASYRGGSNSNAENGLIEAAERLTEREGSRAIVVVTDGDASAEGGLLDALEEARARVFVIKVPSGGMWQDPTYSQPVTMLWAGQTGGEMHYVLQSEDISIAYARASARLLGPKAYSIRAETETRILEPGQLKVTASASEEARPATSKLVILDASGSMLKRLENDRRINIAKAALQDFVAEQEARAEAGRDIRLGLRVFGGPPHSCKTELVEPVQPLNGGAIRSAVKAVSPRNNAKTAIGAAIRAAANDLSEAEGSRSILLITDGEETCGGDPAAAIARLEEKGIETRIDVVSFALEPEVDRRPFEAWAKAGGGIFVDAETGEDLTEALEVSAQTRFDVLAEGEVIASGVVGGDPVELEVGNYEVAIEGQAPRSVTVRAGKTVEISS